jgi:putative PIN family toxin of toxin-antitoxin system
VSPTLLAELRRVLARPKFRRYADQKTVDEYVTRISRHAQHVDDPAEIPAVTRDPDDDYLVALGRRERVDAIVSVDLDLLDAEIDAPVVRTPRQIVDSLSSS